jgi:uncharacterized protein GlcG (DUF336 family)
MSPATCSTGSSPEVFASGQRLHGQIIGAVGVGGGTDEQDAEVTKAGIQALVEAIRKK